MRGVHKHMLEELELLKTQLKELLYENASELRRTRALLLDNERKVEDRFAKLHSFQTMREEIGKKLRKRIPLAHDAAKRLPAFPRNGHVADQAAIASPSVAVSPSRPVRKCQKPAM